MDNVISPKMVRLLTTAIVRRASKYYPNAGVVGYYSFAGHDYRTKAELRIAVVDFCEKLTYGEVVTVKKNLNLV